MAQHPIQIHIVVSGETFTCSRDYARDEEGFYMQSRSERFDKLTEDGHPQSFDTISGAVLDAIQAVQRAFALMRAPDEFIPEIIPMAVDDVPRGDLN